MLHVSFQKRQRDNLQKKDYLAEIIILKSSGPADHSATGPVIGTYTFSFLKLDLFPFLHVAPGDS